MEVDISKELETIKTEKYGETVVSGITDALDILVDKKFKTVDLSEEKTIMKSSPYGNEIKQSILDSLYKLSKVESVEPIETEYFTTEQPFSILNNLKRCEIPEGTKIIDENAFKDADSLQVVEIPEGVETIGAYAFSGCESLEEIVFPKSLMYGTRSGTVNTKMYHILDGCTSLGSIVIQNPGDLTVELPKVTRKSGRTYDVSTGTYTQNYVTYHTPTNNRLCCWQYMCTDNVYSISGGYTLTSLESVTLPENTDMIYEGMFDGCTNLVDITIPSSVKVVGAYAFRNCKKITSDIQLRNVEYLGSKSLSGTGIEMFDTGLYPPSTYIAGDVISFSGNTYATNPTETECNTSLKTAIIDSGRTCNGDGSYDETRTTYEFDNCVSLERVEYYISLGSDIKENYTLTMGLSIGSSGNASIGTPSFANCYNLEYVKFSDSETPDAGVITIPYIDHLSSIVSGTFRNCKKLTRFSNLYKNMSSYPPLVSIGSYAFYGSGFTEFYIPPPCKSIGTFAFANCKDLAKVDIDPESCLWEITKATASADVFSGCSSLTSFEIPFKWTLIPNNAFKDCVSLTSVSFEHSVANAICTSAFENTGLTSITLPAAIKTLQSGAFMNCSELASASITGVTSISDSVFENCTSLVSVTLPSTLSSFNTELFRNTGFATFTIQASVTSLGTRCLAECQNLETVTMLGVKTIANYAFLNCPSLTEVNISSSITTINQYAFNGCDGITFNIDRKANAISGYATGWGATNFTINWTGTT